jgi:hypothetical protein
MALLHSLDIFDLIAQNNELALDFRANSCYNKNRATEKLKEV